MNCEHRIGFFADEDADAGTELLFNYGRRFHEREQLKDEGGTSEAGKKFPKTKTKGGQNQNSRATNAIVQPGSDFDHDNDDDNGDGDPFGDEMIFEDLEGRQRKRTSEEDDGEYVEEKARRRRAARIRYTR